jgi:EAL domain-containing protein (putative c-di-GMP-specific phosphodiesterase class I)/GGDEF domain-containing protein
MEYLVMPRDASQSANIFRLNRTAPLQPPVRAKEERYDDKHIKETEDADAMLLSRLKEILGQRQLSALFQPIANMQSGTIIGYEGLIRGPSDSPLHSPLNLFKVARTNNLTAELERLCCGIVAQQFAALQLPGKLFLNISPGSLLQYERMHGATLGYLKHIGISPERVIIELTENQPAYDYELLREAVMLYRGMGFQIAIDDLGEGFSSLRLWSELRPEYVKIDMHFIQGIGQDPVKLQFVRSIQEIAKESGSSVIAEGIETQPELLTIRDLGIAYGQGYHLARPCAVPAATLNAEIAKKLGCNAVSVYPRKHQLERNMPTASKLLSSVPSVSPEKTNNDVYQLFSMQPELQTIPVVDNGLPVGLITRSKLIDYFARPYLRELQGRKPCTTLMDAKPLVADKDTSLQDLSQLIVEAEHHHLSNGFIITEEGRYVGMGTGQDLMRELTQMQINAARYANPLTLLPGNVPINEHIDLLLHSGAQFSACYADLDHFKAFNDVYGYRKGDDVIQLTARLLTEHCESSRDFVGHIGGDDFLILFQSPDWEARCRTILNAFAMSIAEHYTEEDRKRGGYFSEDRRGRKVFHPLISLSIGLVRVSPGHFGSHYQVAAAAAEAKKESKKIIGNSLFIERRTEMA